MSARSIVFFRVLAQGCAAFRARALRRASVIACLFAGALACSGVAAQNLLDVSLLGASAVEAKLGQERAKLQEQRAELAVVEQQLSALPAQESALETTLTRDVRALYRLRRGGLLPIADGLESLMGHASRVAHFERMTRRTLARLVESRRTGSRLALEVVALGAQIATTEQELATLEQSNAALAREAEVTRALEQGAPQAEEASPRLEPSGYGLSLVGASDRAAPIERFAPQRGQLALPLSGAANIGTATNPQGEDTALTFASKPGASVRAVASGRVVMAEPNEGHGILVIVDHGDRYRTIYGGLSSADVQAGDSVSKSARLGAVGSAPLYFEVRRGMRSQDARGWLGL